MKKQILTGFVAIGMAVCASAQGTITFDNGNANPAATINSTSFGLIFIGGYTPFRPLDLDINLTLLGGPTAGSLSQIATLTFVNGLAQGDNTAFATPGQFADLSGSIYSVPGVPLGGTGFFEIQAWYGSDATYSQALAHIGLVGNSGIFQSATGGVGIPPAPPSP